MNILNSNEIFQRDLIFFLINALTQSRTKFIQKIRLINNRNRNCQITSEHELKCSKHSIQLDT